MCGKPKVTRQDPEADARKAAEQAALKANAEAAARRTRRNSDTLTALGSGLESSTALNAGSKKNLGI